MGQKIHPVGLRLGITRTWDSRWFEKKHYKDWLHEDVKIRKYFTRWMRPAAISKIEIERRANQARVIVNTGKPGIIIGKRGVGIEEIRKNLETLTGKSVQVNVMEIKHPELDARLVAQNIVDQLEKRIAFRRAEIARTERNHDGKVPLHTLRADIDYANVEAFTTFGRIGVKVWIYRGEVLPDHARQPEREGRPERPQFRDRRERGGRGGRGRGGAPRQETAEALVPETAAPEPILPLDPAPIAPLDSAPIAPLEAAPIEPVEAPSVDAAPIADAAEADQIVPQLHDDAEGPQAGGPGGFADGGREARSADTPVQTEIAE